MEARTEQPLIVIVGPTASGKTALAIELAEQLDGEIICADSRTIYKYMNIGTAKPTAGERARVPHWGIDLVEPNERYTVADFKRYAEQKIEEIRERGKVPFLVGGTGLYIDAVIFDYQFGERASEERRRELEALSLEQLNEYCIKNNINLPENQHNKRYVIRAIEQRGINTRRRDTPIEHVIIVGIATEATILRTRIEHRAEQLFKNNVVEEAMILGAKYGWDNQSMTGNIYPLVNLYRKGELTLDQIKERFTTLDWQLARRQMTWFKRGKHIKWLSLEDAKLYIDALLANR